MAGLENLTGTAATTVARSPKPPRRSATSPRISTSAPTRSRPGLRSFSNSGLKEFEAFAVDGRRTLAELQKVIKNIDQHPSRLIFGQ